MNWIIYLTGDKNGAEVYFKSSEVDTFSIETEADLIATLAKCQLNLEKNINKDKFEHMSLNDIMNKLHEETQELESEFFREKLDFQLIYNEIGDVAACLTGLLAFVKSVEGNK